MSTIRRHKTLYPAEVIDIVNVTPRMRRITVADNNAPPPGDGLPAQWMKLFFPAHGDQQPTGRAYTIRRFDPDSGRITFDFVLHGDEGPASRWAGRARVGDVLQVGGPRGGHLIDTQAAQYVLVGDATALPAIAAILEAMPSHIRATALIEVADMAEAAYLADRPNLDVTWLYAGTFVPGATGLIERAIRDAVIDTKTCQVWIAGESAMMKEVRAHLLLDRGVIHPAIDAAGYWKLGSADHRERD
ncbi:siderophore-interacting protein [Rhodopseudomonas telluris]|uniref:Siderophore-interacting protein n=1 Tax=Rhodopseudomonas telluris TaxID=644215 RepID=A0ABV6EP55_9BRAD